MTANEILEKIPDVNILEDEGITLDGIQEEMIADYQEKYSKETKKDITLYPANPKRLELMVMAGQIYQAYEVMSYYFKQNFIKHMDDDILWNWGANLGFYDSSLKASVCTLEFEIEEALKYDVTIPEGTRVTAGDDVFFATDSECVIEVGELSVQCQATCTEEGSFGNGYIPEQINIIADPVPYVSIVKNIDTTHDGSDEYSSDELREKIFMYPSQYSSAGPEDAYVYVCKQYSSDICSAAVITDNENATVKIYVLLQNGELPDLTYCKNILNYIKSIKKFPDTDKIEIYPAEKVEYEINAQYFIDSINKDIEGTIKENVQDAAMEYTQKQYEDLGVDINPDMFKEFARVAGAKRTVVTAPTYQHIEKNQVAICTNINVSYSGLEGD